MSAQSPIAPDSGRAAGPYDDGPVGLFKVWAGDTLSRMTLTEWMLTPQGARWTCETFAQAVGAKRVSVVGWRAGRYRPNGNLILRIALVTQGFVGPSDWFPELTDQRMWPVWPQPEPSAPRLRQASRRQRSRSAASEHTPDRLAA